MQRIGATINIGAFYIIGVPLSIVLGFVVHMRAKVIQYSSIKFYNPLINLIINSSLLILTNPKKVFVLL